MFARVMPPTKATGEMELVDPQSGAAVACAHTYAYAEACIAAGLRGRIKAR